MCSIKKLEDIVESMSGRKSPVRLACINPVDYESLMALRQAADKRIIRPVAVGDTGEIKKKAESFGVSLEGFDFQEVGDYEEMALEATKLVHSGSADLLMKGSISTRIVMQAVLDSRFGLRGKSLFSHIALFDVAPLKRLIAVTDPAINIRPNLTQKVQIIRNAVEVLHSLGIRWPKVAILAAIEKPQVQAMPTTLDAKIIERMAGEGLLGEMEVQGPLALDDAVSKEVAKAKGIKGSVAGNADILVAPQIETGNVLYKSFIYLLGLDCANITIGGIKPIVLVGRTDTVRTKYLSIALGAATLQGAA
ncbi:MAG: phosphate butyryltransferase [Spirochaetes bacterium]|nr:phosphate butyryltransferase [Spirochaetota bacterium]